MTNPTNIGRVTFRVDCDQEIQVIDGRPEDTFTFRCRVVSVENPAPNMVMTSEGATTPKGAVAGFLAELKAAGLTGTAREVN